MSLLTIIKIILPKPEKFIKTFYIQIYSPWTSDFVI